jgi:serine/threonine-protein kinase
MNHDGPPSTNDASAGTCDESEVARVFDAYLADLEAGRPVDPARLLADHPAIAEELRACLDVMHLADQMAKGSGAVPAEPRTPSHSPVPGTSRVVSLLTSLGLGPAEMPQVLLRELPDESERLARPRSTEMPPSGVAVTRYQLQGEIARGGMGAILRGRDIDLGRDLAIKVMLEAHRGNPEVVRRFVDEAQIGGQLQHPGIVPVYELGTFPDRRPYFAMKLVKGETLASLLQKRTGPAHDLPRFLAIFEQVCQTVAYTHARGVIHRDLKPSNVMVGSFGEVQVMDWGLAKVLPQGGVADEGESQPIHETIIVTVRSGSSGTGSESQAGSVLGTPAYMAPEQARGEMDRIDERADVFGLGAILCEVLTGQPPFVATSREEIRAQAARGDLANALGRLERCDADGELIELVRSCLRSERDRRPRNAGEVAGRIKAYLVGVQERLKAAELARVQAQAKAVEERKRRRLTVALAASVLGLVVLGSGGGAYLAWERTARLMATTRVVTEAMAEAERLRGQAQSAALGDLTKWSEALGAARRARDLLAQGQADDKLQTRVATALVDLQREQVAAQLRATEIERDRKLLGALETIRGNRSEHWDPKRTDAEYAAAFRDFGIDLDQLDPKAAGRRIAQRSAPVELCSFVDDWAFVRRRARGLREEASWQRLIAAAQAADPDPWRVALRDRIGRGNKEALRRLARDEKALVSQSATSLVLLAEALIERGDWGRAEQVLRRAWQLQPSDFWVSHSSGIVHSKESSLYEPEEEVRFRSAAVAIRPRSHVAHNNLGVALAGQGKLDEAITEFREALRLKPDYPEAHNNLGNALPDQGKLDEAIAESREALRLRPDYADAHITLGAALESLGKLADAVAEFREALRLKPDAAAAHNNLGTALREQERRDEAITEFREALRLKPDDPEAHNNLGKSLAESGQLEQAISSFREALQLRPRYAKAHYNLGHVLSQQGKRDQAITEYREALRLEPDDPAAHLNLGHLLRQQGSYAEALAELRRGHELGSKNPRWPHPSAKWVEQAERLVGLDGKLPAILSGKLKPADATEALGLALLCLDKKLHATSARLWTEALQAGRRLADDMKAGNRYNAACDAALAGSGQGKDDPPLDGAAKARWRKQASDWLKADLAAWSKLLQTGPPQARESIAKTLTHWKADPDLTGVREPTAVAKLPPDEQQTCRALWAEVDALLTKAAEARP